MVERDGLENRCILTSTEGSNPSPSARKIALPNGRWCFPAIWWDSNWGPRKSVDLWGKEELRSEKFAKANEKRSK